MKEKKFIGISIFGYENKKKYPIYISKKIYEDKHVDFLSIGKRQKALFSYQRF